MATPVPEVAGVTGTGSDTINAARHATSRCPINKAQPPASTESSPLAEIFDIQWLTRIRDAHLGE